jgi:hypothetical protein
MRGFSLRHFFLILICAGLMGTRASAQQDAFHWVDFHAEKDQAVVTWVTRTLDPEKWTAIREIGVLYDAALVVTTTRATPQATPSTDTFQVWSVSLTKHVATPVLKGVHLQWLDWIDLAEGEPREMAALYEDCSGCAATTYFTAFHYDMSQHLIVPRWMRGSEAVPVWSGAAPEGVRLEQVYAVLTEPNGREYLGTWNHFDYGKQKPAEDYLYRYDLDPLSGLERTQLLSGKDGDALKQRLCAVQGAPAGLARGRDSALCEETFHPRATRRPVTTPPANNQGRSTPPGARPK